MPKNIQDMRDLFIEQGRELYDISIQEEIGLQKLMSRSDDLGIKRIIEKEIEASRDLRTYIQKGFRDLNVSPLGIRSASCKATFQEANSLMERSADLEVRDAIIINAIQRLNHSKIEGLDSLLSYGEDIDEQILSSYAQMSLKIEKEIDSMLSDLAMREQ